MTEANNLRPWATCKDATGAEWMLRINLLTATRLRAKGLVDLLGTDAAATASQVAKDAIRLIEIAYAISEAERTPRGIATDEAFLELFDGNTVQDLIDATMEAIIDFFPKAARASLMKIWNHQKSTRDSLAAKAAEKLEQAGLLAAIDNEADQAMAEFDRNLQELGGIRS